MNALGKTVAVALVALAAAVLLCWLSEANEAAVAWGGDVVRLGGPIAGFAAVFLILDWAHRRLPDPETRRDEAAAAARRAQLGRVAGAWRIESRSNKTGRSAVSSTRITVAGGRLNISGGVFREASGDDADKPIGDWSCEVAMFDGDRLIYLCSLTDHGSSPTFWRGVVDAWLTADGAGTRIEGRWQVFGQDHHDGVIAMRRED